MPTRTRAPAKTRRRRDNRVAAKPRKKKKTPANNGEVAITEDRLVNAKEAERHLSDARLELNDAKANYGAAKAALAVQVAKRNRIISLSDSTYQVDEAQALVAKAERRVEEAKEANDEARDELKAREVQLQRALAGEEPLFDDLTTGLKPGEIALVGVEEF